MKKRRINFMQKKLFTLIFSLLLVFGFTIIGFAAKVPSPAKGGDGFTAVTLDKAKQLFEDGATIVACHSHTTDFMKGHPEGTIHITCLVPKDHKKIDMPLNKVEFDIAQLPANKNTPIMTYCASSN